MSFSKHILYLLLQHTCFCTNEIHICNVNQFSLSPVYLFQTCFGYIIEIYLTFSFVSNPSINHVCIIFSYKKDKRFKQYQGCIKKETILLINRNYVI